MKTLDFPTPFIFGDETIGKAEIARMPFARFVALSQAVMPTLRGNQKFNVAMQRHCMIEQITLVTGAGKKVKLTSEDIGKLPPLIGCDLAAARFFDDETPGILLSAPNADGISAPIHYKLGMPIKAAQVGKDITELEFQARTFSDLEEITAGDSPLSQTYDMIATMGRPVGGKLLALPSWAVDQISLADGLFIMNKVLPSFLK